MATPIGGKGFIPIISNETERPTGKKLRAQFIKLLTAQDPSFWVLQNSVKH